MAHTVINNSNRFEALLIEKGNSRLFYVNNIFRDANELLNGDSLAFFFFQTESVILENDAIVKTEESFFFFFPNQFYPCRVGGRMLEPIPSTDERQSTSLDKLPVVSRALLEHLRGSLPCPRVPWQCTESCLRMLKDLNQPSLQQVELPASP